MAILCFSLINGDADTRCCVTASHQTAHIGMFWMDSVRTIHYRCLSFAAICSNFAYGSLSNMPCAEFHAISLRHHRSSFASLGVCVCGCAQIGRTEESFPYAKSGVEFGNIQRAGKKHVSHKCFMCVCMYFGLIVTLAMLMIVWCAFGCMCA